MAVMLGALALLDHQEGGIFLVPPFAATLTILLYLPDTPVARPIAVVCGSVFGAAIGTLLSLMIGTGVAVAVTASLTAAVMLSWQRIYHPPGVALAMYPALFHPGPWFAVEVVLPFASIAVISSAVMYRLHRAAT